ncbi:MAG: Bifunctional aspartokinase/homoserine dehydrogenase 2 [Bacteroidetes bacterium ADurb.Bin012]|nr:MAG: Bifunctional aspartokinase/homoserine dehydrogenase 2 [Bacteroidetes bacterium ADurb.Bin012]
MEVFKFGGASLKDAQSIKNIVEILNSYHYLDQLVVVVSAMGKTTNAFEKFLSLVYSGSANFQEAITPIKSFHWEVCRQLFAPEHDFWKELEAIFDEIREQSAELSALPYDMAYDRIVGYGEILASRIFSVYQNTQGIDHQWLDARSVIRTDSCYRAANVNIELSCNRIRVWFQQNTDSRYRIITQGFIGQDMQGNMVTLGREGSDYSAALFATALSANSVVLWKDVPGVMNADPDFYAQAMPFQFVSYREAIELTYYGAKIIHPKTIKPLENAGIPLFVRPFLHPTEQGTRIGPGIGTIPQIPSIIHKSNQILITISHKDLSFITEKTLSTVLSVFDNFALKINLMQNSALTFSICLDDIGNKIDEIFTQLMKFYEVKYNRQLTLLTFRHYAQQPRIIDQWIEGKLILVEQRSRNTAQYVIAEK